MATGRIEVAKLRRPRILRALLWTAAALASTAAAGRESIPLEHWWPAFLPREDDPIVRERMPLITIEELEPSEPLERSLGTWMKQWLSRTRAELEVTWGPPWQLAKSETGQPVALYPSPADHRAGARCVMAFVFDSDGRIADVQARGDKAVCVSAFSDRRAATESSRED